MLNAPIYFPYTGQTMTPNGNTSTSPVTTATTSPSSGANSSSVRSILQAATMKDSRWLTLEVCRQYQRNACTRDENECKFAHPPSHVEIQYGRVMCCYDSIKGKCQRKDPPCKYLHPPLHLKEQLVQNGRNNLFWKSLQLQILQQHQQQQHDLISGHSHHFLQTSQAAAAAVAVQRNTQTLNSMNNPNNADQPKLIYPDLSMLMNQHNQNHLQFLNGNLWLDQYFPQMLPSMNATQYFGAPIVDSLLQPSSRKRPIDSDMSIACNSKLLKQHLVPTQASIDASLNNKLGINMNNYGVFEPELLTNIGIIPQPNSNCLQTMISTNDTQASNTNQLFSTMPNLNHPGGKRHAMIDAKNGLPIFQANSLLDQQNQQSVILDPNLMSHQVSNNGHEIQLISALANATATSAPVYGTY